MTNDHADAVRLREPDSAGRVFVLGEFLRLAEQEGARGRAPLCDWVAAVDARRPAHRRRARPQDELADPLGEPIEVYRALAAALDEATRRIATLLSAVPLFGIASVKSWATDDGGRCWPPASPR